MTDKNLNASEKEIDLLALLKESWDARKIIIKITILFLLLGLFIAVFSKKEFTASTTFVPLAQGGTPRGSALGGLASLAGINLGSGLDSQGISPELYPKIFSSIPFQLEIINTLLSIEGQSKPSTYRDYYENIHSLGVLGSINKYTLGLPRILIGLFKDDTSEEQNFIKKNKIIKFSFEEQQLILRLEEQLSLDVNTEEGFVSISATMPEPVASAQLALRAQQLLQEYTLKFKTQKSIAQLNYIKDRYLEKQKDFDSVKIALATFQDQNKGINTALGKTKLLQLQSEYDLTFSVYTELAKQQEAQILRVKENTPIFTVLEPVSVPILKSSSSKFLIVFLFLVFGFCVSFAYVFGRKFIINLKTEFYLKYKSF